MRAKNGFPPEEAIAVTGKPECGKAMKEEPTNERGETPIAARLYTTGRGKSENGRLIQAFKARLFFLTGCLLRGKPIAFTLPAEMLLCQSVSQSKS